MPLISRRTSLRILFSGLASLPLLALGTRQAQAATHVVNIQGFAFNPPELEVAVGDTVAFRNLDGAPHTATSQSGAFDTGTIKPGKGTKVRIVDGGAFEYTCRFHPSMHAVIIAA